MIYKKKKSKKCTWKLYYQRVNEKRKGKCFIGNNDSFHTIFLTDTEHDESSAKGLPFQRGKQKIKQIIRLSFPTEALLTCYSFNHSIAKVHGLWKTHACTHAHTYAHTHLNHILVFTYNFITSIGYWKRLGFFSLSRIFISDSGSHSSWMDYSCAYLSFFFFFKFPVLTRHCLHMTICSDPFDETT